MALNKEQIQQLKKQLHDQIKNLPEKQKKEAEAQIESLSDEAIEEMLEDQKKAQKPIFRAIVSGEMPSKKIDENKNAIAVLDIRPLVKGHVLILPKKEVKNGKDIPTSAFSLAKKVAKRISNKLKASSIDIRTEFKLGEIILEIIPIYGKPIPLSNPRQEPKEEELQEIQFLLKAKPKVKREKKKIESAEKKQDNTIRLKRRIA